MKAAWPTLVAAAITTLSATADERQSVDDGIWVFVDPNERLVIAKLSYWSEAWNEASEAEFRAFVQAVREHLKSDGAGPN